MPAIVKAIAPRRSRIAGAMPLTDIKGAANKLSATALDVASLPGRLIDSSVRSTVGSITDFGKKINRKYLASDEEKKTPLEKSPDFY